MTADPIQPKGVASAYWPPRQHYWYARCKLASDPLYAAVGDVLRGTTAPLLDLGCGIGLLAQTLRAQGFAGAYLGIDNDAAKIDAAEKAMHRAALTAVRFDCIDLAQAEFPAHRGSVTLLDVLQFLPADAVEPLIARAAGCLIDGARLVVRTGIDEANGRTRFTRLVDRFSQRVGWMNARPCQYPTRPSLTTLLAKTGLTARWMPLGGYLPFNNWLIVAERAG